MIFAVASNNAGKLAEIRRILTAQGHEVKSQRELGYTFEVDETGTTFEDNALLKAAALCEKTGLPTIADDSGLCVDALGGAPGVYSARYCGHHGDDEANNDKLLLALQNVPRAQRGAKFVSAVCLALPGGASLTTFGECPGWVGFERRGTNGFGYDPIFYVGEKSYAQLTDAEKDGISHRGKALALFAQALPGFLANPQQYGPAPCRVLLRPGRAAEVLPL